MQTLNGEVEASALDHVRAVLRQRAEILARAPEPESAEEVVRLVVLVVSGELYGVDVRDVREIRPLAAVAPVPGTPSSWLGLMNLRGNVHPVLDLAGYLGLPRSGRGPGARVVLVSRDGTTIGLVADDVLDVRRVPTSSIGSPLGRAAGGQGVVTGLTDDLLSVLDLETLLQDRSLSVDEAPA